MLYGGSVTSAAIDEFLAEPDIDGALVGGASLKVDEMAGIVARAGMTARARLQAAAARRERRKVGRPRPLVLVVLDGFGVGHRPEADAIAAANMPVWRGLLAKWPHALLGASEGASACPTGRWATARSAT